MFKIILLFAIFLIIIIILRNNSKKNFGKYNKLFLTIIFIGFLTVLIIYGKFLIPQLFQILKIGLPFLTKFIGI